MSSPDDAGRGFDRREVERERERRGRGREREGLEAVEMEGGRWREERRWWWERRGDEIADMVRDWSSETEERCLFWRLEFWNRERGRVERLSELSGS